MKRLSDRLMAEHAMSYQVVRAYVADRKPRIRVEAGRGPVEVFFPQSHRRGAEAGSTSARSRSTCAASR